MRRRTRCVPIIVLASTLPACRDAPSAPSAVGVPPAGEYTLQISEAPSSDPIVVVACLTISPGAAPVSPIISGAVSLRVLMEMIGDEAIARLPSPSGANGGDLRLTFAPAVRGAVSGTIAGRATAADGRSGFHVDHGTLTGTATDGWRRASGRIQSASMSFTAGGTTCSSSETAWQLSRP